MTPPHCRECELGGGDTPMKLLLLALPGWDMPILGPMNETCHAGR